MTATPSTGQISIAKSRPLDRLLVVTLVLAGVFSSGDETLADEPSASAKSAGPRSAGQGSQNPSSPVDIKSIANSSKVIRYAQNRINKYDMNRDGVLQTEEWKSMKGDPGQIDTDKDGTITLEEMATWIASYPYHKLDSDQSSASAPGQSTSTHATASTNLKVDPLPQAEFDSVANDHETPLTSAPRRQRDLKFHVSPKRLPEGLPDWFITRDKDGDAQLTESEFCTSGSGQELAEFKSFDTNGDGVVTAKECAGKSREKKNSAGAKPATDGLPSANPDAAPKSRRKTKAAK